MGMPPSLPQPGQPTGPVNVPGQPAPAKGSEAAGKANAPTSAGVAGSAGGVSQTQGQAPTQGQQGALPNPTLPAATGNATPNQQVQGVAVLFNAMNAGTPMTINNARALRNMGAKAGINLTQEQQNNLRTILGEQDPVTNARNLRSAMNANQFFSADGNLDPQVRSALRGDPDNQFVKLLNDPGQFGALNAKGKDSAFNMFSLMMLLMDLQDKKWQMLDEMKLMSHEKIIATMEEKKDVIMEKAVANLAFTIASSLASVAMSGLGLARASAGKGAEGSVQYAMSLQGQMIGQMGGPLSQGLSAAGGMVAAGYDIEMVGIEQEIEKARYNKEEAQKLMSIAQQDLEKFYQTGTAIWQDAASTRKSIAAKIA